MINDIKKAEDITASDEELNKQLDAMAERYKDNKEAKEQIYSPRYREYVSNQITNQKAIDLLRKKVVK